jgi:spore germination protein YaaH
MSCRDAMSSSPARGAAALLLACTLLGALAPTAPAARAARAAGGAAAGRALAGEPSVGEASMASTPAVNSLSFSADAASACAGMAPSRVRIARLSGPRARLSWHAPSAGTPITYRVLRAAHTLGQTTNTSMVVRVTPGRRTAFTIQARYALAPQSCPETLRVKVSFRAPSRVQRLRLLSRTASGVRIGWRAARRGDASLSGYRIRRDGVVVGQTHRRNFTLRLSTGRSHRVTVAAVDVDGHLGPSSKALTIGASRTQASTTGPSTPGGVSVSDVADEAATLWWLPSRPGGARIVGYRVYRDDQLVGQAKTTSMRLTHLSSTHTYLITIGAVDADKRESARTPPFRLTTTHTPPAGPALLSAEHVTDTSATLSWQAGSANSGTLVGYLVFKDGQPEQVVHGQIVTVKLASQRSYVFTVRALDSAGYLSAPAPNLTVVTTHTPPSTPGGLAAGEVTDHSAVLGWSASAAVSGQIVGYRVFRNGIPVGQTATTGMTLSSLAPSTTYDATVVAVDSLGAISAPTPALAIQTAPPTQTHGNVQAFLLASTDQSFDDLEAHYQQIGVVYPTYFNCGVGGAVTGVNDPLVTGWAQARGVVVMPRLNCQNPIDEDQILNEPAVGQSMIEQIASLCATYGYGGIQIDFEGAQPSERNQFTAFITALAARLHAQGDKLSTIVTAKYYNIQSGRAAMYDDAALSGPSDYVLVLDWGLHWTTSGPGGMDELPWFKRVAEYTATLPNRGKFVLGMPMYGIDWTGAGGPSSPGTPLEFDNIAALLGEYGITPEWNAEAADPHFSYVDPNGLQHNVWYTDQQSVGIRVALAESLGLGIGLWHLGSEDQSIWELPGLGG